MQRNLNKGTSKQNLRLCKQKTIKHTSTVLDPSIPFHTLVKLVVAEDIANDKKRTHDLTLEVNNITKQLQTQTLDPQKSDQVMFAQPRDPNNKTKPAYKKYCSYCHRTNHSISACFKKQRDDEDRRDAYARSKSLQKSFVQYFRSSSNDKTSRYDTKSNDYPNRYRSRSTSRSNYQKNNSSQTRQRFTFRTRYNYDQNTTHPHYTRSRYDKYQAHIVHHTGLLTGHHTHVIHVPDTNFDLTPEKITSKNFLHIDLFQDIEILDVLDLVHILIQEIKSIIFDHNIQLIQSTLKYMYHQAEMANALTPTNWLYSLYTHASPKQNQREYPSRLEIPFLLDSGASTSVLNYLTYGIIAKF